MLSVSGRTSRASTSQNSLLRIQNQPQKSTHFLQKNHANNTIIQPHTFTKRYYPRQPKVRVPFESPWDMLERYKRAEEDPPRLKDAKTNTIIGVHDRNVQDNIQALEKLREEGKTPGEDFLNEAPELSPIIERIKQSQAKIEEQKEGTKSSVPQWSPSSRRVGAIGLKLGMLPQMDSFGQRLPLTAIWIPDCQVTQVKTEEKDGRYALQLGAMDTLARKVTKPLLGHFQRAGVNPKTVVSEFPVTKDALLPEGTTISARHFMPGQFVDVKGATKGKGFQGPMKRWGFSGLLATHGVSLAHRSHGSTGQRKSPGHVFKGKRMAGQMGNRQTQTKNLYVFMVDFKNDVIFLHGSVPGSTGSFITVNDALFKHFTTPPPFPTFVPPEDENIASMTPDKHILRAEGQKPGDWDDRVAFGNELLKKKK
eukprot:gb/GECH01012541.1/.p1 GENE.gb/GECH01012541.1/~~gb/GECH01012541.1/.p1  ORF type:complete len:423 (+),score=101.94 gb/GECH01012541.1/:1-1269(+)